MGSGIRSKAIFGPISGVTGTIYLASISVLLIACCYWRRANSWGAGASIFISAVIPDYLSRDGTSAIHCRAGKVYRSLLLRHRDVFAFRRGDGHWLFTETAIRADREDRVMSKHWFWWCTDAGLRRLVFDHHGLCRYQRRGRHQKHACPA